ncbi:MAG: hypothetical protein AUJ89_02970 [Candidatus Omnitrophica bacterium CG1_02_43_210]|nr:MAG: hypothetical protein AUJ89_02970 [Candidatus Omnitrophica bacterium CG1_02_43_210]
MDSQNKPLAWVAVALGIVIITLFVRSYVPDPEGINMRGLIIFLYLIPIGFSIFFLTGIESLIIGIIVVAAGAYAVCGPHYTLGPLFSTGIIWQLFAFLILSFWAGLLSSRLRNQSFQSEDSLVRIEDTSAMLQTERVRLLTQQKKYAEDINSLNSMIITLSDLAKEISSILDPEGLLKLVMGKAVKLFSAKTCAIFHVDTAANKLSYACSVGYYADELSDLKLTADEESGMAGWCAKNGKFMSMDEIQRNPHLSDLLRQNKFPIIFCQPIVQHGKTLAVICVGEVEKKLDELELMRFASTLANLSAIAMENAKFVDGMKEQAIRDGLTGLYNHRYFYELLDDKMKNVRKAGTALAVFLIDIDHFKKFNDTYGHQLGDFILQKTAAILSSNAQKTDVVARYGGEEFVIVSIGNNTDVIAKLAEGIRVAVEGAVFSHGNLKLSVTISLGVAFYDLKANIAASELVKFSDQALYKAKESGRNKVCFYS